MCKFNIVYRPVFEVESKSSELNEFNILLRLLLLQKDTN